MRDLVDFVWRVGDLGGERDFVGPHRALAGVRGHQKLQRSRPADYQREVLVAYEIDAGQVGPQAMEGASAQDGKTAALSAGTHQAAAASGGDFVLRIEGRVDGLQVADDVLQIEEIKTVEDGWDGTSDPVHWAQARIYAFIASQSHPRDEIEVRLTYLNLDSGKITELVERRSAAELAAFFRETTTVYVEWLREHFAREQLRNASIRALAFPFPQYRPGQRDLAVAAYRTMVRGGRLFLEAPTGIGKTVSLLFPAVKAVGEGKAGRIFYLTARTTGRAVAEQALADLRRAGLVLRSVTLTAKEKICVQEGQPCDPATCPLARGYYDRRKPAMREILARQDITRPVLEEAARRHQVCPFELSLDLSTWVDAVICDYNYVFDPRAYLRRHFAAGGTNGLFLVDEAHNLVDRAREMFSADLAVAEIREVRRAILKAIPRCARAFSRLNSALRRLDRGAQAGIETEEDTGQPPELRLFGDAPANGDAANAPATAAEPCWVGRDGVRALKMLPEEVIKALDDAMKQAETWLARNQPAAFREALIELYFQLYAFRRTAELYDERYVTLIRPGKAVRVQLFCVDPSHLLAEALERGQAAVFFSATLTPLEYYRDLLGGKDGDRLLRLPSPFPPAHLAVLVQDRIRTQFNSRAKTLPEVVDAIGALVARRRGNYLVYLPSYEYLRAVCEQFRARYPELRLLLQQPGMTEPQRDEFLAAFAADHPETLVGFAVLGGVFGEGIDLVGDRLIGAVIVGVGLPQLCAERDLMRDFFQERLGAGFDYAYTYPGMNRVLQAVGRVIRSETDRGVVVLIDTRFAERRYRGLFPAWWQPRRVTSAAEAGEAVGRFWEQ